MRELCLPAPGDEISVDLLRSWHRNIELELNHDHLSVEDRAFIAEYYQEAGLLRDWRRPFFEQHILHNLQQCIPFLLAARDHPTILDLGCGFGTQAILLALMGASVVGVDLDDSVLRMLERRREFYERASGRSLDITTWSGDALELDYDALPPLDGFFSLFAFNMIQPSSVLLDQVVANLSSGSRLAILDGNRLSWSSKVLPWRRRPALSPPALARALEQRGLSIVSQSGGVSLPPVAWSVSIGPAAQRFDAFLNRWWIFPVSHLTMAESPTASRSRIGTAQDGTYDVA